MQNEKFATGSHNITIQADLTFREFQKKFSENLPDLLYIPGGIPGAPTTMHELNHLNANLELVKRGVIQKTKLSGWMRAITSDVEQSFTNCPLLENCNLSQSTSEQMIHGKYLGKKTADDILKMKKARLLLLPFAALYWLGTSLRNMAYDLGVLPQRAFGTPVICVGNITVGGTGKTPLTEHIVSLLSRGGRRVAVVSRGYMRKSKGQVVADEESTASQIGDEPCQMKRKFPYRTSPLLSV